MTATTSLMAGRVLLAGRTSHRCRCRHRRQSTLRALGNLVDLIGHKTMRFTMYGRRSLGVRSVNETEDLAHSLIDPIVLVVHPILGLGLEISLMRSRDIGCRYSTFHRMYIHIRRHAFASPPRRSY